METGAVNKVSESIAISKSEQKIKNKRRKSDASKLTKWSVENSPAKATSYLSQTILQPHGNSGTKSLTGMRRQSS